MGSLPNCQWGFSVWAMAEWHLGGARGGGTRAFEGAGAGATSESGPEGSWHRCGRCAGSEGRAGHPHTPSRVVPFWSKDAVRKSVGRHVGLPGAQQLKRQASTGITLLRPDVMRRAVEEEDAVEEADEEDQEPKEGEAASNIIFEN